MKVRAKFVCCEMAHKLYFGTASVEVRLAPVTDGSDEDRAFWQATPSGSINLLIQSDAAKRFELGQAYYVDFTPAD